MFPGDVMGEPRTALYADTTIDARNRGRRGISGGNRERSVGEWGSDRLVRRRLGVSLPWSSPRAGGHPCALKKIVGGCEHAKGPIRCRPTAPAHPSSPRKGMASGIVAPRAGCCGGGPAAYHKNCQAGPILSAARQNQWRATSTRGYAARTAYYRGSAARRTEFTAQPSRWQWHRKRRVPPPLSALR